MKKVIYLFLMVVLSVSCFDDFLTEEPETLVTNNNFWQNEKDVESAVYGMHRWFRWVIGGWTYITGIEGYLLITLGAGRTFRIMT